jgi:hypothetical protein
MAQWGTWDEQQQDDDLRRNYDDIAQMGAGPGTATPAPQTAGPAAQGNPFAALGTPMGSASSGSADTGGAGQGVSGFDSFTQDASGFGGASGPQTGQGAQTGVSGFGAMGDAASGVGAKSQGSADGISAKYTTQLQQLKSTTDPRQKAVLQDQIGRSLYSEFKSAGHDVSWDGDQMVVDGRRYVIGDGSMGQPDVMPRTEGAGAPAAPEMAPPAGGMPTNLQQGAMTYGGTGLAQAGGTRFEGFNDDRALAGGDPNSAKDGFRRIVGSLGISLPPNQSREVYGGIIRDQIIPALLAEGYPVAEGNGMDTVMVFSNERGWEEIDIIGDATGNDPRFVWGDLAGGWGGAPTQGGGGQAPGATMATTPGTQGATGVQTQNTAIGPAPTVEGIGDLSMTGPGYQAPTDLTTEGLPSRSYEDILGGMGSYEFNGFGDLSAGTEAGTESLINRLLENPESLDARTVDMMKAASREEAAAMGESLDEDLVGMGFDMGIDSSNFLASERLGAKRSRDEAIQRSNRGIEIEAAKVNQGDRRAAATLGASYSDAKRGRNLSEAQARESNVFNAAQLKGNNAVNAARIQLEQAAALNDRVGLIESTKQAAAELGISRDKLMADFAIAKANELTQRYGIDVSKFVDLTKLQTANSEFKDDLAFRLMALQQQMELEYAQLGESGRQFNVGAGIDLANLQQRADEFGVNSYYRALGF